jgi:uncharacterized membrane protein YraQ (UPF0718 family)
MELTLTVANIVLAVVLAGIAGIWIYLLAYMGKSFRHAPTLNIACPKRGALHSTLP